MATDQEGNEVTPPAPRTVDTEQGLVRIRITAKSRVFPLRDDGTTDRQSHYWTFKRTHERDAYVHKRGYAILLRPTGDENHPVWVQADGDDARQVRVRKPGERGCYLAYAGCEKPARRGSYFCSAEHAARWGEQMVRDEAKYDYIVDEDQNPSDVTVWCIEHECYITTPYSHADVWGEHHLLGTGNKPWQPAPTKSDDEEDGDDDE